MHYLGCDLAWSVSVETALLHRQTVEIEIYLIWKPCNKFVNEFE